jgi:hypothetical protein
VITITFSPLDGEEIALDGVVVLEVTSPDGIGPRVLTVSFRGLGFTEVVFDGLAFTAPYQLYSAVTAIADGYRFTFRRNPIWPDAADITLWAIDGLGGELRDTAALHLPVGTAAVDSPSPVPNFPVGPGPSPLNISVAGASDFIRVIEKVLDPGYVQALRATPRGGYELFQMFAAVGARAAQALGRLEAGGLILAAPAGTKATGSVELYRETAAGVVDVLAGSLVTTSRGHRTFKTLETASFGALDLGPHTVAVEAIAVGPEWNVPGQLVTAAGEVIAGEIDTGLRLNESPVYGDASIQVRQLLATTGGEAADLTGLGFDRGMTLGAGETTEAFRLRVRTVPDTVSPAAMRRIVAAILAPFGATYTYIETHQLSYQSCWDAPAAAVGSFTPGIFVWDDTRPRTTFRNRWLDSIENMAAFIIVLPDLEHQAYVGQTWDDTALTPAALYGPITGPRTGGRRAVSCWDMDLDAACVTSGMVLPGGYDGFDLPKQAVYCAIAETLRTAKPAGASALLELQGQ